MNAQRKKGAVLKYESLFKNGASAEDLKIAVEGDEKKYSPDEVAEIVAAIIGGGEGNGKPPNVEPDPKKPSKETKQPAAMKETVKETEQVVGYEEWRMEWVGTNLSKLKLLRKNVKISEQEVETLNAGASAPGSFNPIMYFKPE